MSNTSIPVSFCCMYKYRYMRQSPTSAQPCRLQTGSRWPPSGPDTAAGPLPCSGPPRPSPPWGRRWSARYSPRTPSAAASAGRFPWRDLFWKWSDSHVGNIYLLGNLTESSRKRLNCVTDLLMEVRHRTANWKVIFYPESVCYNGWDAAHQPNLKYEIRLMRK